MKRGIGEAIRLTKQYFSPALAEYGVKASNKSVQAREEFISKVTPYINRVLYIKEHDKVSFKNFMKLPKTKERIMYLNNIAQKGVFETHNAKPQSQRGYKAKPQPQRGYKAKPQPQQRVRREENPQPNIYKDNVAKKASEVHHSLLEREKSHEEKIKINRISAFEKAHKEKFKKVETVIKQTYLETERLLVLKEEKYLTAKENVKELRKQLKVLTDEYIYYSEVNKNPNELYRVEQIIVKKKKQLLSVSLDLKHYAPKKKKSLGDIIASSLLSPFKLLLPVKQKELSTSQLITLKKGN